MILAGGAETAASFRRGRNKRAVMAKNFPKMMKQKSRAELGLPSHHVCQPQGQGPFHFTTALCGPVNVGKGGVGIGGVAGA